MAVRKTESLPRYSQVERSLLHRIQREFKTGQMLPTQHDLAHEYGTSLITIRRALDEIARKGFLQSTRGRGTVVIQPQVRDERAGVASWTEAMTGLGRQPSTIELRITTRVPPAEIAHMLDIKSREKTVVVQRVRALDGAPVSIMWNELPLALVPDLQTLGLTDESLYTWLKKHHGYVPHKAAEEVEARMATGGERHILGADTGIVMVVHRHTWMADSRPLEAAYMVAPAHRYRYGVEIFKK